MSENIENKNDEVLEIPVKKERRIIKPCRICGEPKNRAGSYCEKHAIEKAMENRKKHGNKPHYKKRPCTDCKGERDRNGGYLCSNCHLKRAEVRKEIKNELKNQYKQIFNEKIKN